MILIKKWALLLICASYSFCASLLFYSPCFFLSFLAKICITLNNSEKYIYKPSLSSSVSTSSPNSPWFYNRSTFSICLLALSLFYVSFRRNHKDMMESGKWNRLFLVWVAAEHIQNFPEKFELGLRLDLSHN